MADRQFGAADGDSGRQPPAGPFLRDQPAVRGFRHVGAQSVSVVFYSSGGYTVAGVEGIRHHDKKPFARPTTICEIVVGTFQSSLELALPAAGGTTFFQAEVDIQWKVVDPYLAAVSAVRDVVLHLRAPVLERLRRITQNYGVQDAQRANEAVTAECESGRWDDLGDGVGLWTRLFVRLTVDAKTIDTMERLRDDEAEHAREIGLQRQKSARLGDRMRELQRMLEGNRLTQLAYMLAAGSEEEARAFMEQLRQEDRGDQQRFMGHVIEMINRGQIRSDLLEDQIRDILGGRTPYRVDGPISPRPVQRQPERKALPGPHPEYTPRWVQDDSPPRPAPEAARGPRDDHPTSYQESYQEPYRESAEDAYEPCEDPYEDSYEAADTPRRAGREPEPDWEPRSGWEPGPPEPSRSPPPRSADDGWPWAEES